MIIIIYSHSFSLIYSTAQKKNVQEVLMSKEGFLSEYQYIKRTRNDTDIQLAK